jgi:uncharacterized membrane protein YciS (DUF1049 family)
MSFKALFKLVVCLAVLFAMLYVGMNNTKDIDFWFPVATTKKITESAALIYFGFFAVGALFGAVLMVGGGGGKARSSGGGKN